MAIDRDAVLASLRSRLRRYTRDDDEAVSGIEALEEVAALIDADEADLDVWRVCGLVLWCRSVVGTGEPDDLISALALLEPVWRADATRVPEEVAEYFRENGAGPLKVTDVWQGPAHALGKHAKEFGDARAAALAVTLTRRIVAALHPGDPEHGMCLANLAMLTQVFAETTGDHAGLDEAISAGRLAITGFAPADPRRTVAVVALAVALRRKSGGSGDLAQLDEAIELSRAAVAATPAGDPARPGRLSNLGVALTCRFEWTGRQADLDAALEAHREAVSATPASDGKRRPRLVNLASTLLASFEDTGNPAELAAALTSLDQAATTSNSDEVVRIAEESTRCAALRARYRRTGNSADLDRAVQAGESAVSSLPPHHPELPSVRTNLSLAYHRRALRTGSTEDLNRAITSLRAAIDATPAGHPDRAGRLSNLSDALLSRADLGGPSAGSDVDEAVTCARAAADAGTGHRRRAYYLSNFGNALMARHAVAGGRTDLDEAIAVQEQAVRLCPPGAAHLAHCLANLAVARHRRYEEEPAATEHLDQAIARTRRAALTEAGPVEVRVRAAVRWGHWAATSGRRTEALTGYTAAVGLLADVSPAELPRDDQEFELTRLGGVVTDAAACAIQAGNHHAAVQLLERGRGIVHAHALPDTELESFTTAGRLDGPIVLVNVSRFRSDALLLADGGVGIQPLPLVDPDTVRAKAEQFLLSIAVRKDPEATAEDLDHAERAMSGILVWLWDAIACPVLDALGITGQGEPRRLWWCPTGLLAILPLHAAGRHGTAADTVVDRVISSTTPSLRALVAARRAATAGSPDRTRLLLIASDVLGLPAARSEQRLLADLFPGRTDVLTGSDGQELARYGRIHVAGHAEADLTSPSRGRIPLGDGRPPLTAGALSRLRPADGELAFLSACETALTSPALADETVHLASVLHVAGYRHVVATLWAIADRPAFRIARAVYRDLSLHGDPARIPAALHRALLDARDRYPDNPLTWAAYLHLGP